MSIKLSSLLYKYKGVCLTGFSVILASSLQPAFLQPALAVTNSCPVQTTKQLEGRWVSGEYNVLNRYGVVRAEAVLDIRAKSNFLVETTYSWSTPNKRAEGNHLTQPVSRDTESLLGVFNPRLCELTLVETQETGFARIFVLDQSTLEVTHVETGERPVVYLTKLKRQK